MKKLLYLTDLAYQAKGRNYCEEDIFITGQLRAQFDIALCHPQCAEAYEDAADLVVFRNTGGVSGFQEVYDAFVRRVKAKGIRTFNTFTGKADMCGKQYLPALSAQGYPVIPTVGTQAEISRLPEAGRYVLKPRNGADSVGLEFVTAAELQSRSIPDGTVLIQPEIDFLYEVSFYFINDKFEYALYAPDRTRRWALEPYQSSAEDLAFARRFIEWNTIPHGIQRVDACRTKDGRLLLVELEDLNPYLSLLETDAETRACFLHDLTDALHRAAEA